MVTQSLQIVGIVGGSCAGKTWLASRLESLFPGRAVRLSQDDFTGIEATSARRAGRG